MIFSNIPPPKEKIQKKWKWSVWSWRLILLCIWFYISRIASHSFFSYIIQPKNHLCNYKSNISLFLSLALPTMSTGRDRLLKNLKKFADFQYKIFTARYGQQLIDIFEFPVKLVLSPFTLAIDIAGSAPRGFGVPELVSKLSYMSIFVSFCKTRTFIMWEFICLSQSLRI